MDGIYISKIDKVSAFVTLCDIYEYMILTILNNLITECGII